MHRVTHNNPDHASVRVRTSSEGLTSEEHLRTLAFGVCSHDFLALGVTPDKNMNHRWFEAPRASENGVKCCFCSQQLSSRCVGPPQSSISMWKHFGGGSLHTYVGVWLPVATVRRWVECWEGVECLVRRVYRHKIPYSVVCHRLWSASRRSICRR